MPSFYIVERKDNFCSAVIWQFIRVEKFTIQDYNEINKFGAFGGKNGHSSTGL